MAGFIYSLALFAVTALAEILGCYLPYLWLRENRSAWLLLPAALSLAAFVWLGKDFAQRLSTPGTEPFKVKCPRLEQSIPKKDS